MFSYDISSHQFNCLPVIVISLLFWQTVKVLEDMLYIVRYILCT